jgi:hypothetical protein
MNGLGMDAQREAVARSLNGGDRKLTAEFVEVESGIWIMHLTRTSFDLAADNPTAAKQIRKILCKGGVKIRRNELSIVSRNRDWIRCAFVLELGAPGVLN